MDLAERHVLDVVPVGLQVWEAVGDEPCLRYENQQAQRLELPDGDDAWRAQLLKACLEQEIVKHEFPVKRPDGTEIWWRAWITPLGDRSILVGWWDYTTAKEHERSLRASERLNREILAGLQEGVVVVDTDERIVVANEAAAELFGVSLEELTNEKLTDVPVDVLDDGGNLLAADQLPLMRALRGEEVTGMIVRVVRRDGTLLWVEVHANPLHHDDGVLYGAVASYDDVTARVEQDRRMRREAETDPLTGLANRRALERTLDAALTRAVKRSRSVGVVMLDLDGFKAINDNHGHAAGDEALREVARRLRGCVRERDLVARLGGDEFVLVLTDVGGRSGAVQDAVARIQDALATPVQVNDISASLRAAIGVAVFPGDGADAADLIAHADRAMYAAKGLPRNGRPT
jgi:diguanylate cyclase (GGDEF)-like protein/PAS domain S-box-containing protein